MYKLPKPFLRYNPQRKLWEAWEKRDHAHQGRAPIAFGSDVDRAINHFNGVVCKWSRFQRYS